MNAFLCQALAVTLVVSALLALTRRGGTLAAGVATAAITAPTLLLLAALQGREFALFAAAGTLLSTPLCAGMATLGLRWLARGAAPAAAAPAAQAWGTALMAGLVSALVCACARDIGALASGVVSGLPVVAAWTMLGTRRHSGGAAAARYLCAYRRGLWLRGVMTVVFASTVLPLGAAWAMLLGLAASGIVVSMSMARTAQASSGPRVGSSSAR